MGLNLCDINSLDPKTIHTIHELQLLMKSLGPERLTDLCMTLVVSQLQTEINLAVKTDVTCPTDFFMEAVGRILLLINEQDTNDQFSDKRH